MTLSWNEIRSRATAFSKEWQDTHREEADAKPFLDAFFHVFGISRKKIGTFEHKVKKLNTADGYIDMLWKGAMLVEMKSRGQNLQKAFAQALEYAQALPEHELPKYILICDFNTFLLYDTEEQSTTEFLLKDLVKHVNLFGFLLGYQKKIYKEQDPANIKAAELMGKLHDRLEEIGYSGHVLEIYLVRILFCLFAEDTTIFNKQQFQDYIEQRTAPDGSDLAPKLQELFQVLNTERDKRFKNLDEDLAAFPYVNGRLFEEPLPTASFDSAMRQALLNCCYMDWSKISPAIFGSMFQSVMNPKERRNLGAHYTSEKNILKLIKPLFLDELWADFEKARGSAPALRKLHERISRLRFLDPACGCGNFLIIAYRELRLLEIEILKLQLKGQTVTDIGSYILLDVDKFYGIEYEEFPAQIAQVAMWLIDHQMNMLAGEAFGDYYVRLPLRKSATIVHGNALRIDWQSLLQPQLHDVWNKEDVDHLRYDYIMGNPPFVGKHLQNAEQKDDIKSVFSDLRSSGDLDYVSAWYKIACDYLSFFPETRVAFVSTNSITQGEQVAVLWEYLIKTYNIAISFAHRTFKWTNEAKGKANVHVVIIGFGKSIRQEKILYDYENPTSEPHLLFCKNITPYLLPGENSFIRKQQRPICNVPEMRCGNKPSDGGYLILSEEEKDEMILNDPSTELVIKKFVGSIEFLNNKSRWCLWFKNIAVSNFRNNREIVERVQKVKEFRLASTAEPTKKAADYPAIFFYCSQPANNYIVIPEVSSERRKYIPLGILDSEIISSNKIFLLDSSSFYYFGILSSLMHMAWVRVVAGRMKSDYSYSGTIVYNTFPWPDSPTDKQKAAVEAAAQQVLEVRKQFMEPAPGEEVTPFSKGVTSSPDRKTASLADLYDPNTMPPALVKAHQALDKAVDACYRPQPFPNETKRIEFLFELYDKYTAGLFVKEKKGKRK